MAAVAVLAAAELEVSEVVEGVEVAVAVAVAVAVEVEVEVEVEVVATHLS